MSYNGWACLGGVELWNQDRAYTYAANGWKNPRLNVKACGGCGPDFALALAESNGRYSNPGSDRAPWWSASEPDSFDFGGLLVLSVDGLGPGEFTRSTTPRASGRGSFFGPGVQGAPVITVEGILLARTCCALDYGLRWLTNVLHGSCDADCEGDDLTFLDCCPGLCEDSPSFESYPECLEPHIRTLKGVTVTGSPRIIERIGNGCRCGCGACDGASTWRIRFELTAGQPCVYREPQMVESGVVFTPDPAGDCEEWVLLAPGEVCPEDLNCPVPDDCLVDVACPAPPAPPTPPAVTNSCICDPHTTARACIDIPANTIPEYTTAVPVIQVSSGSNEIRQLSMQFIANPLGLSADQLDPCTACGEVTLSRIPAYSTFTMDGRNRTVTVECPGSAVTDATPLLGQGDGRLPFRFPEVACGGIPYVLCATVDAATVAPDASIAVSIVAMECP